MLKTLSVLLIPLTMFTVFQFLDSAHATTYYVSPNGDNSNPGTHQEPWATPGYGSRELQPGDTLIILGGKYILSAFDGDIITPLSSGRDDAWIVIKGEEGNRPVLAGRNNLFSAIILDGVSYIRIENLEITSDNGAPFRDGINDGGNEISHIVLKELHIHHLDEFGINLGNVDDMLVEECNITHCGFGAVGGPAGETGWRNISIKKTYLSYSGHYYQGGSGPSPYDRPDGFGIEPSVGPVNIVDCLVEHNRGDGLDSKAENTFIRNCIVANNSCDGIKLWGDGSRVHNSLVYGTGDGAPNSSPWAALVIGTLMQGAYFEIINVTIHDTPQTQNYPMYVQYDSSTSITFLMRNSIVANGYGLVFIGDSVNFIATTTDPEEDQVSFRFEWGDESESEWTSFVDSGSSASASHSWSSEGIYQVRVKAKDTEGAESSWSTVHQLITRTVVLEGIVAFPNPFSLSGHPSLTFWGIQVPYSKIRIFTIAGELVITLDEQCGSTAISWEGSRSRFFC